MAAYVSIRQHTSAYICRRTTACPRCCHATRRAQMRPQYLYCCPSKASELIFSPSKKPAARAGALSPMHTQSANAAAATAREFPAACASSFSVSIRTFVPVNAVMHTQRANAAAATAREFPAARASGFSVSIRTFVLVKHVMSQRTSFRQPVPQALASVFVRLY